MSLHINFVIYERSTVSGRQHELAWVSRIDWLALLYALCLYMERLYENDLQQQSIILQ